MRAIEAIEAIEAAARLCVTLNETLAEEAVDRRHALPAQLLVDAAPLITHLKKTSSKYHDKILRGLQFLVFDAESIGFSLEERNSMVARVSVRLQAFIADESATVAADDAKAKRNKPGRPPKKRSDVENQVVNLRKRGVPLSEIDRTLGKEGEAAKILHLLRNRKDWDKNDPN